MKQLFGLFEYPQMFTNKFACNLSTVETNKCKDMQNVEWEKYSYQLYQIWENFWISFCKTLMKPFQSNLTIMF